MGHPLLYMGHRSGQISLIFGPCFGGGLFCRKEPHMEENPDRKPYFFCPTVCSHRTGAHLAKKVGIVYASSREEAETLVWEKHGSDISCEPWVDEVSEEGYEFTVYKSEI